MFLEMQLTKTAKIFLGNNLILQNLHCMWQQSETLTAKAPTVAPTAAPAAIPTAKPIGPPAIPSTPPMAAPQAAATAIAGAEVKSFDFSALALAS